MPKEAKPFDIEMFCLAPVTIDSYFGQNTYFKVLAYIRAKHNLPFGQEFLGIQREAKSLGMDERKLSQYTEEQLLAYICYRIDIWSEQNESKEAKK